MGIKPKRVSPTERARRREQSDLARYGLPGLLDPEQSEWEDPVPTKRETTADIGVGKIWTITGSK